MESGNSNIVLQMKRKLRTGCEEKKGTYEREIERERERGREAEREREK
jgi:hypothetical protein